LTRTWTKIPDATKDKLVLKMVETAPIGLKMYYDIGKDGEDDKERNWVGGWYLRRSICNAPKRG
jgi:hypothetical protein